MAEASRQRVVLTGAPGTGKTSVLEALSGTFAVVGEPARRIIAEHRARTGEENLDTQPEVLVSRMAAQMVRDFDVAGPGITVYDRGLPDCLAYLAAYGLDTASSEDLASRHRYDGPIFLFSPWRDIYTTDDMRKAAFADVEAFHTLLVEGYESLGYDLIEVPRVDLPRRAEWVANLLA